MYAHVVAYDKSCVRIYARVCVCVYACVRMCVHVSYIYTYIYMCCVNVFVLLACFVCLGMHKKA